MLRPTLFLVHHPRPDRHLAGLRPDLRHEPGRARRKTTLTPAYLSYTDGVRPAAVGPGRGDRVHPLRDHLVLTSLQRCVLRDKDAAARAQGRCGAQTRAAPPRRCRRRADPSTHVHRRPDGPLGGPDAAGTGAPRPRPAAAEAPSRLRGRWLDPRPTRSSSSSRSSTSTRSSSRSSTSFKTDADAATQPARA